LLSRVRPGWMRSLSVSGSVVLMIDVWSRTPVARGCDGPAEPGHAPELLTPGAGLRRSLVWWSFGCSGVWR
jgi:hypothetical protein